jgi:hypothetical protein
MTDLEVFGDLFEGFQWPALAIAQGRNGVFQAMVDVILDQRPFGLAHGFFHRVQLLRDVHALTAFFDHGDNAAQVAVSAFEALDDRRVALVDMGMGIGVNMAMSKGIGMRTFVVVIAHEKASGSTVMAGILSPQGG